MERLRAFFLLALTTLLISNSVVSAKTIQMVPLLPLAHRLYALWEDDEKKGAWEKLRFHLRNPPQLEGLLIALDFLKMRIFDQKANHPVYFIAHAQLLWLTNDKSVIETSAISAGVALLLLQTDQARCAEAGAGQTIIAQAEKDLAEPLAYLAHMPLPARRLALKRVLDREALVMKRPPDIWLCADAPKAQEDIKAWMEEAKQKAEMLDDPTIPNGKVIVNPPPPPSLISFVDFAAWQEKRLEVRNALARAFGVTIADPPAP